MGTDSASRPSAIWIATQTIPAAATAALPMATSVILVRPPAMGGCACAWAGVRSSLSATTGSFRLCWRWYESQA
ncbi:MAG: hypothetical protein AAF108_04615 [Planctomycetota bacterium]